MEKTRRFRFLGYGDLKPFPGYDPEKVNPKTHYWYSDGGAFIIGKIYETKYINDYGDDSINDARFIINKKDDFTLCQDLRFFEEIKDEEIDPER